MGRFDRVNRIRHRNLDNQEIPTGILPYRADHLVGLLFLLLSNLGVDSYRFWPVILIVVGAAIIFGGTRRRSRNSKRNASGNSNAKSGSSTTTTEGEVSISCTLGETNERVETSDFTGGTVNVTLGNANLDLRDATIVNHPATLTFPSRWPD